MFINQRWAIQNGRTPMTNGSQLQEHSRITLKAKSKQIAKQGNMRCAFRGSKRREIQHLLCKIWHQEDLAGKLLDTYIEKSLKCHNIYTNGMLYCHAHIYTHTWEISRKATILSNFIKWLQEQLCKLVFAQSNRLTTYTKDMYCALTVHQLCKKHYWKEYIYPNA